MTILLIKDRTPLFLLLKKFDRLLLAVTGTAVFLYLITVLIDSGDYYRRLWYLRFLILASGYIDKDLIMDLLSIDQKKDLIFLRIVAIRSFLSLILNANKP